MSTDIFPAGEEPTDLDAASAPTMLRPHRIEGAARRATILRSGVTRRQLDRGRPYRRVAHDLYVPSAEADTLKARCRAFQLLLPDDAVFSHYTAAQLYGVPVPDEPLIHVCTESPIEPRTSGVVGHRIKCIGEAVEIDGLRVATPARTFLDLAARLDLSGLVVAGDGLARRASLPALHAAVSRGTGRRGVKLARRALPLLDPASRSAGESRLRFLIVISGVPKPLCNQPIYDELGEWIAEADFQYPKPKLAIEYHGDQHRERRQWERDIQREEAMQAAGWMVLRATSMDLHKRPTEFVGRLRAALASRGGA